MNAATKKVKQIKPKKPHFRLEEIGPTKAAEYLKHNTNNRVINSANVKDIAAQMERGLWVPTDQGIGFDWNGELTNGQHRLLAVIESGKTIEIMVARNLSPEARTVTDRSIAPRSASDVFYMRGVAPNAQCVTLAAAINVMHRFSFDGRYRNRRGRLYQEQFDHYFLCYPQLMRWVEWAHRAQLPKGLQKATLAGLGVVFQLSEEEAGIDANVFMDQVASGTGLKKGSPIILLRERIMQSAFSREHKLTAHVIGWLIIKTWNAIARGKPVRSLKLRLDENPPFVEGFDPTTLPYFEDGKSSK